MNEAQIRTRKNNKTNKQIKTNKNPVCEVLTLAQNLHQNFLFLVFLYFYFLKLISRVFYFLESWVFCQKNFCFYFCVSKFKKSILFILVFIFLSSSSLQKNPNFFIFLELSFDLTDSKLSKTKFPLQLRICSFQIQKNNNEK